MGQTFSAMGLKDPRLVAPKILDFRFRRVFAKWKRSDVKLPRRLPIPFDVLLSLAQTASQTPQSRTVTNLMWLGFFFLLRPSEYLATQGGSPFTINDVSFRINGLDVKAQDSTSAQRAVATLVGLQFTEQKNGIQDEIIRMPLTATAGACPVRSAAALIDHLEHFGAGPETRLFVFFDAMGKRRKVTDRILSAHLRLAMANLSLEAPATAGALRCTGATALLNAHTPIHLIKLLGRWRSDEAFRYMHATSEPLLAPLGDAMLAHAS